MPITVVRGNKINKIFRIIPVKLFTNYTVKGPIPKTTIKRNSTTNLVIKAKEGKIIFKMKMKIVTM